MCEVTSTFKFLFIATATLFLRVTDVNCNDTSDIAKNYLAPAYLLNSSADGDKTFFPKPTPTLSTTTTTTIPPCICTCPTTTPTISTTTRTTTTTTPKPGQPCNCGKGAKPSTQTRDALLDEGNIIKNATDDPRIIQGVVSAPNAWPWMAALTIKAGLGVGSFCGGSLINNWFILTAAHCVQNIVTAGTLKNYQILLGSNVVNTADPNRVAYSIASIKMHPLWDTTLPAKQGRNWDFALIRLATAVKFSKTISPICILTQTGAPFANRNAVVAGWGWTTPGANAVSNQLREVVLKVTDQSVCENFYGPGTIKSDQMCAIGTPASRGPCQGDSGGPLMTFQTATQSYLQIGVVSFTSGNGNGCQSTGIPAVFGRVSRIINFIQHVTKGTSFCTKNVG